MNWNRHVENSQSKMRCKTEGKYVVQPTEDKEEGLSRDWMVKRKISLLFEVKAGFNKMRDC